MIRQDTPGPDHTVRTIKSPYHYQEIDKRKMELAGLKDEERRLIEWERSSALEPEPLRIEYTG